MAPDIEERWGTVHVQPDIAFLLCWGSLISAAASETLVLFVPYLAGGQPVPLAVTIPSSVVYIATCIVALCLWICGPAVYWPGKLRLLFPAMFLSSLVPLFVIFHPRFTPKSNPFTITFGAFTICFCNMVSSAMGADSSSHPCTPLTAVFSRLLVSGGLVLHVVDLLTDTSVLWTLLAEV
jgi:hypothetical protein